LGKGKALAAEFESRAFAAHLNVLDPYSLESGAISGCAGARLRPLRRSLFENSIKKVVYNIEKRRMGVNLSPFLNQEEDAGQERTPLPERRPNRRRGHDRLLGVLVRVCAREDLRCQQFLDCRFVITLRMCA